MKRTFLAMLLFVLTVATITVGSSASFAQVKNEKTASESKKPSVSDDEHLLPAPKGFVNDFADILDPKTKEKLEQTLTNFKAEAKIDFVIATVKTTGEKSAFDYSLAVTRDWNVTAKNPYRAGILLLIAVDDRKWHIQITRVLEKVLSNGEVGELGALMRPFFKEQKYGDGITRCVEEMIKVLDSRLKTQDPRLKTQDSRPKTQDPRLKTQDSRLLPRLLALSPIIDRQITPQKIS